jgi:hypothetical protein
MWLLFRLWIFLLCDAYQIVKLKDAHAIKAVHFVFTHYNEPASAMSSVINLTVNAIRTAAQSPVEYHSFVYCKRQNATCPPPENTPGGLVTLETDANEGREGDSMLRYIIATYAKLPEYVLFTQAQPNGFEVWPQRLAQFSDDVRVIALGNTDACGCSGCYVQEGGMIRLRELYVMATHKLCDVEFMSYFNGQMLVSRDAILKQPLSMYKLLFSLLHAPKDHFIHRDLCQKHLRRSLKNRAVEICAKIDKAVPISEHDNQNPLFLHVLERSWSFMFGCENAPGPICLNE